MMDTADSRRRFLQVASAAALGSVVSAATAKGPEEKPAAKPVRVVVWDEQQPAQREAYDNFLGNRIADHLRAQPGFRVKSVRLDDPEQGLSASTLAECDVLIWWGHVRNGEVAPETGRKLVERIKQGTLALIALHSAHWSTPFVEAMHERARLDIERLFPRREGEQREVVEVPPPQRYTLPKYDSRLTPYVDQRQFPDGRLKLLLHLPYCCFPAYRNDGKPSTVRVLRPDHPIVAGVPRKFEIPHTEMYDEPFHVPEPDEVILEECWASGEWFRSGAVWKVGKGRVFYFRPGHETYAVYQQPIPLQILTNAVRRLAS